MKTGRTEQVEITLMTDASMGDDQKIALEGAIRKAFDVEGVKIGSVTITDGSTLVAISLIVGAGLAFCFTHYFAGVFKKLGEKTVDWVGDKIGDTQSGTKPTLQSKSLPVNEPIDFEILGGPPLLSDERSVVMMKSGKRAGGNVAAILETLPGIRKSVTILSERVDLNTQERVKEIYQKIVSPL